jgi:DNA replication factor GINS
MITQETLRKIEDEERQHSKLSKLPQDFLREVSDYLKKKEAVAGENGQDWEYRAASQRFHSIQEMRERKVLNFTLSYVRSGAVPEDMTPEERELFDSVVRSIQEFQAKSKQVMAGEKTEMLAVAFLSNLPEFVGVDMAVYGPYKAGDIATVPADNAKVIAEKGAGEIVEV